MLIEKCPFCEHDVEVSETDTRSVKCICKHHCGVYILTQKAKEYIDREWLRPGVRSYYSKFLSERKAKDRPFIVRKEYLY